MNDRAAKTESLRDQAYHKIRQMILVGELAPGEIVDEKQLMEQLAIGRTPIREALNALTQENITLVLPRKGTYVKEITLADVLNLYQVRECMEPFIVSVATPSISADMLLWFRDNFAASHSHTFEQLVSFDNQFHRYLATATGNPYIVHMMENIYFQDERLRYLSTRSVEKYDDTLHGHMGMIDEMLLRNADKAAQLMKEHIQYSRKVAMSLDIQGVRAF